MTQHSYQSWCVRKCVPTRTIPVPIQSGATRHIGDNATTTAFAASSAMVDIGLLNRRSQVRFLPGALRQGGCWSSRDPKNRPVRLLCVLIRAKNAAKGAAVYWTACHWPQKQRQTHRTHRPSSRTTPRRLRRSPLSGAPFRPAVDRAADPRRRTAQRRPTRASAVASTTTQPGDQ